jgi:sugar phosphate isomerase/epimerase
LLARYVGINLDIAHWQLAGVDWREVEKNPLVFKRIAHAHISGHHPLGHFGDLQLRTLNTPDDFLPWLQMLQRRASTATNVVGVPFSGFVSIECEAMRLRPHDIVRCWKDLQFLLNPTTNHWP